MMTLARRAYLDSEQGVESELPKAGSALEHPIVYDDAAREIKSMAASGLVEIVDDQVPPGTHVLSLANHAVASEVARRPKFTDSEYERGHAAYGEFKAKGHTELTCLRCGNGHFNFLEHNNSLEIRCETPNCLVERIRGI